MQAPKDLETLKKELDRCVKCGMCLPQCPTYRLDANENESPRGRLALIEGLVSGRLQGDEALVRHLDNCLTCRRCERVCPSLVRYGYLIDAARRLLPADRAGRTVDWLQRPGVMRWGTRLAQLVPDSLSRPLGPLHRLHEIARALPATRRAPPPGEYPAETAAERGRVGLFPGCASAVQQGGALHAALALLRRAGFAVVIPRDAACCGALAQHAGQAAEAQALAARNRVAFGDDLDALVSIASGCGIHLDGYQPPLAAPHQDVSRFLLEQGGLAATDFTPLPGRVWLHTPCSMENVYRGGGWARALLGLIPQLEVADAGEPGQCCGAAGDYMLRRPDAAERLRRPVIEQLPQGRQQILLTGNVGCAMHLADGLRGSGRAVEVLHPVELLARQLRAQAAGEGGAQHMRRRA